MVDPVSTLTARFADALEAAFGAEHRGTDPALRRSDRADLQANVALSLAKKVGRPPREVAAALVEKLDVSGICDKVEIAGPGFLNLTLAAAFLERSLEALAKDPRLGLVPAARPETVVIDYSAPNVAKEMHVGHLRSTILGDALARVLEALGHRVIAQNHLGDWGTPFGMLIEHLCDTGLEAGSAELSAGDLGGFYKQAREKFDADPGFADRSRKRVVELQAGDEKTLGLWRELVAASHRHFTDVYRRLGVRLTESDARGESFYGPMLAEVVTELRDKGLVRESDGALCAFPPGFTGREGEPLPLIVQKQDGGYGYGTTDLAALRYRTGTLGGERLLYVVGAPQQQHLAMVFAVGREAGWLAPPARAEHVAFGSILGADRKMFKTRAGGTIRLVDLLEEAVQRAAAAVAEKSPTTDEAERSELARAVGIGAVKYADLSSDRVKDYVFDYDRMLSFEGNTAPYLMYAHARIRSIFRKTELDPASAAVRVPHPAERALAMELLGFGAAVRSVADSLEPHKLCTYLYDLASAFTTFYERCPVLRAEDEAERGSRLFLCDVTARVLARGLDLLGIVAPERM